MSDLKILQIVQAIGNSEQQLEQLLQELNIETEYVSKDKKFHLLTYEASIRQNRLKDYESANRVLKRALELPQLTMQQKVQIQARIVMNLFQRGQYKESRQQCQILQPYLRRNESLKSMVFNIYCGHSEKSAEEMQMKSIMMEIEGRMQQAAKLEQQAYRLYDKQGINAIKQKKFSQYRLSKLNKSQVSSIKMEQMNEMEMRNQTLKTILNYCAYHSSSNNERKQEKQLILQKMVKIYQTNNDPMNNQKLQKIKQFLKQFRDKELPLNMKGTYAILDKDEMPQSVVPQNMQSRMPQSRMPQSTLRQKPQMSQKTQFEIPNTFSQLDYIPEEQMEYWQGSYLIKLNFSSSGQQRRYFYVQDNKMYYCSKRNKKSKDDEYYPLKGLLDVKQGKTTETMNKKEHDKKDENLCFSLQYGDRTRDFCAQSQIDFKMWVSKLRQYLEQKKMQKSMKKSKLQSEFPKSEAKQKGVLFMSKKF